LNGRGRNGQRSNGGDPRYYQVMFKKPRQEIFVGYDDSFNIGDFVKVEADRGEDLGQLVAIWSSEKFNNWLKSGGHNERSLSKFHKRMLRLATQDELDLMVIKTADEEDALNYVSDKCKGRNMPMVLVGAEYQFDRHKLTFYFEADRRIDFRELVRELFSTYKTRIWLQQLSQVNRGMPLENKKN
jgi:cell fate regulator YaaT (PSP1 superfamily)